MEKVKCQAKKGIQYMTAKFLYDTTIIQKGPAQAQVG